MSCSVCLRDSRGYGFTDPAPAKTADRTVYRACSINCLEVIHNYWKVGDVLNPTKFERQALEKASDDAGAYLEKIGKTDLATLTLPEWQDFLALIFESSTGEIARLTDEESIPF